MSDISEKTKIPVGWAATIIGAVIGVAFNAGISHYRLQALEREWERAQSIQQEHRRLDNEHQLKLQKLDINLSNISQRLDSIDKKLDNIGRK